MNIGICTTDLETRPSDIIFERIHALDLDTAQFAFASVAESDFEPNGDIELPERITPSTVNAIRRSARSRGVRIGAVNGTYNMAHPDDEVRREGIKRFRVLTEAVRELECPIISLCSGSLSRVSLWMYHPDNNSEVAWYNMSESMKYAADIAEKFEVTLAIETEASNVIDTPEKARRIMDDVGSARLKMIMDAANLFHRGKAKRQNVEATLTHASEVFGRDVVLAHGKDIRESDGIDFCATGEGIVDFELFKRLLEENNFSGDFMLHGIYDEAKMPTAVEFIRRILG